MNFAWVRNPYLLAFLEAFLVGATPLWGYSAIGTSNGATGGHIVAYPTGPMLIGGALLGLLNGIRAVRNVGQAPPSN